MRAYRLLTILMLLQARGQVTARELAERLEVSRRTVYRDLEALAAAGAPVYAERGGGGGWKLLEDRALQVPTLDNAQRLALQLGGRRDLQDDLGLRGAAELAWARLEVALGRDDVAIDERLLVDSPSWRGVRDDVTALPIIQQAVFRGRRLQICYERSGKPVERIVDPLGLVVKGRIWYLIAAVNGQARTYRVSRVLEATTLPEPVERPDGFQLRDWWAGQQRDFVEQLPRYVVRAKARGGALESLRRGGWYVVIEHQSEPDEAAFCELQLTFNAEFHALGWAFAGGEDIEVLEPPELRTSLIARAKLVLDHYQGENGAIQRCPPR